MRGKYSPTVSRAYQADQEWWRKYTFAHQPGDNYIQYDPEGYDSYGYDKDDRDRAGNCESDYYADNTNIDDDGFGENYQYNQALEDWGYDGVKPVSTVPEPVNQMLELANNIMNDLGTSTSDRELIIKRYF